MQVTLNTDQNLFVIKSGNSVSCLGFEEAFNQSKELASRLLARGINVIAPLLSEKGTLQQYTHYQELLKSYHLIKDNKTWFDSSTPAKARKALESLRLSGNKARVFIGDTETGRDWLEEFDTIGRVARSSGAMKTPLLISEKEYGGPALLTSCVLRIIDLDTKEELYRHPKYFVPKMEFTEAASYDKAIGYTHSVLVENERGDMELRSNFKSIGQAAHWLAFMQGTSHDFESEI